MQWRRARGGCLALTLTAALLASACGTGLGPPQAGRAAHAPAAPPASASQRSGAASRAAARTALAPLEIVARRAGQLQRSGASPAQAMAVDFVSAQRGWALGRCSPAAGGPGCSLLATRNGGTTWSTQYRGLGVDTWPILLQFVNANDGFVADTQAACTRACPTDLLATTDGGRTWRLRLQIPAGATAPFLALDFVNAEDGWEVLRSGLEETRDGGVRWSPAFSTAGCSFRTVHFSTPADGWAGGSGPRGPCLYRTVDGGRTWRPVFTSARAPSPIAGAFSRYARSSGMGRGQNPSRLGRACGVQQVKFTGASDAWLVVECLPFSPGAFAVLRTADGGHTWSYVWGSAGCLMGCQGDGGSRSPLFFLNGTTAWRVVPFGAARTTDGGRSWSPSSSAHICVNPGCSARLSFVDAANGWAATAQGVFVTHDGGRTWRRQLPAAGPGPLRAVDFVSPATGYAVPEIAPNSVLVTHDGGHRWARAGRVGGLSSQRGGPPQGVQGLDFLPTGQGWAWGAAAVATTTDGGRTWRPLPRLPASGVLPSVPAQPHQLAFVNAEDGWLLGVFGGLWRTRDGGQTWTRLPGLADGSIRQIAFSDTAHGYATVFARAMGGRSPTRGHFALLATADAGATWTPVAAWPWPPPKGQFNTTAFSFASPAVGWLLARGGILRTTDGARHWTEYTQPGLAGLFPRAIQFVNATDGWLLSSAGALLHSTDGGRTWNAVAPGGGGAHA